MSSSTIRNSFFVGLSVLSSIIVCLSSALSVQPTKPDAVVAKAKAMHLKPMAASALSRQPFSFEENRGQTDARVKFIARSPGAMVFISPAEITFRLDPAPRDPSGVLPRDLYDRGMKLTQGLTPTCAAVRMRLVGANPRAEISGLEPLASRSNYFIGIDPAKWHSGIKSYRKVRMRNVYPGIDVVYYGKLGRLEYDLIVGPHSDPSRVRFEFEGADGTHVAPNGDVVLNTVAGAVELHKAVVYQKREGKRSEIDSHYTLGHRGNGRSASVTIKLASYKRDVPVVIDPGVQFTVPISTIYGGSGLDQFRDGDVDASGNIYVAGQSSSTDFPTTVGAYQTTNGGSVDAVVVKFDPAGTPLASTFVGGSGFDSANAIWVTSTSAFVVGTTFSPNSPVTDGSKLNRGKSTTNSDAFLLNISAGLDKLNA
jgi:hypothetical protein